MIGLEFAKPQPPGSIAVRLALAFTVLMAAVSGVYVPRFYRWHYADDGTVAEIEPIDAAASLPIVKRFLQGLPPILTKPIVWRRGPIHRKSIIQASRLPIRVGHLDGPRSRIGVPCDADIGR